MPSRPSFADSFRPLSWLPTCHESVCAAGCPTLDLRTGIAQAEEAVVVVV